MDLIYLRTVSIYEECQASVGPDQRIYLHVVSWKFRSTKSGVLSAECGVRNWKMRSVDYGVGKQEV